MDLKTVYSRMSESMETFRKHLDISRLVGEMNALMSEVAEAAGVEHKPIAGEY